MGRFPENYVEPLKPDGEVGAGDGKSPESNGIGCENETDEKGGGGVALLCSGVDPSSDEYELFRFLEEGVFHTIYLAKKHVGSDTRGSTLSCESADNGYGHLVCVKAFMVQSPQRLNMALAEAAALSKTGGCRNVCTFFEAFVQNNIRVEGDEPAPKFDASLCIVTEYCSGGTLEQMIQERRRTGAGPFPERDVLKWIHELSKALSDIHNLKVLHRDLHPGNIFVDGAGILKIGNFGIAQAHMALDSKDPNVLGSRGHIAPEVRHRASYTHKSDIWSMGVVMLELLTLSSTSTADQLRKLSASLSPHAMKLLLSLLSPNPAQRPSAYRIVNFVWNNFAIDLDRRLSKILYAMGSGPGSRLPLTVPVIERFLAQMKKVSGEAGRRLKQTPRQEARSLVQRLGDGDGCIPVATFLKFLRAYYERHPSKLLLIEKCIAREQQEGQPQQQPVTQLGRPGQKA